MKLHLKILWSIIEHRKVSTAVTFNPLMTAVGYTYQGHDIGWRHSETVPLYWALKDTTRAEVERDNLKAKDVYFKYERLLTYGVALAKVAITFRNSISVHLGPTLAWVPAFQISVTLNKISPPTVYIPATTCVHFSPESREKRYRKDVRNMYRDPTGHGWPHGTIPKATLAHYEQQNPTPIPPARNPNISSTPLESAGSGSTPLDLRSSQHLLHTHLPTPPPPAKSPTTPTPISQTRAPPPPPRGKTPNFIFAYISQGLLDLQIPKNIIFSTTHATKGGRTARPTLSPVCSAFVPSPTPSPFPTPPSLPSFYMISDNHTSSPTHSSITPSLPLYTATLISDDLVINIDTKAKTPPGFSSMELKFTSRSTFPPFMDFPSRSHHSIPKPQPPEAPKPTASDAGSASYSSMPSLVTPSLSPSSSLSSPMTCL
jgi:hypothetical protein